MRKAIVGVAIGMLAAFSLATGAAAADRSTATIQTERITLIGEVHQLVVVDDLRFSSSHAYVYWTPPPGAAAEPRTPGIAWVAARKAFRIPAGAGSASFLYVFENPSAGMSLDWLRTLAVRESWVYTSPGVSVPIELNQHLYAQGSTWLNGMEFTRANATNLPAGPLRLNVEVDPAPPPVFYSGLWLLLAGALLWTAAHWLSRLPRRTREVD